MEKNRGITIRNNINRAPPLLASHLGTTPPSKYLALYGAFYLFYQLCSKRDPRIKKYRARKYVLNSQKQLVKTKEFSLSLKQRRKLLEGLENQEYKEYSTRDLTLVPSLPQPLILSFLDSF